jgi:hypothetical protein
MSTWEYRVLRKTVKSVNEEKIYHIYQIIEVYYNNKNEIDGWIDLLGDATSNYDSYDDLKSTIINLLPKAFNKPVLVSDENDNLSELI